MMRVYKVVSKVKIIGKKEPFCETFYTDEWNEVTELIERDIKEAKISICIMNISSNKYEELCAAHGQGTEIK